MARGGGGFEWEGGGVMRLWIMLTEYDRECYVEQSECLGFAVHSDHGPMRSGFDQAWEWASA